MNWYWLKLRRYCTDSTIDDSFAWRNHLNFNTCRVYFYQSLLSIMFMLLPDKLHHKDNHEYKSRLVDQSFIQIEVGQTPANSQLPPQYTVHYTVNNRFSATTLRDIILAINRKESESKEEAATSINLRIFLTPQVGVRWGTKEFDSFLFSKSTLLQSYSSVVFRLSRSQLHHCCWVLFPLWQLVEPQTLHPRPL